MLGSQSTAVDQDTATGRTGLVTNILRERERERPEKQSHTMTKGCLVVPRERLVSRQVSRAYNTRRKNHKKEKSKDGHSEGGVHVTRGGPPLSPLRQVSQTF